MLEGQSANELTTCGCYAMTGYVKYTVEVAGMLYCGLVQSFPKEKCTSSEMEGGRGA